MKIEIFSRHKSIEKPISFQIPDFTVLIGKNGSGKTHLLEAISGQGRLYNDSDDEIKHTIYIPFGSLTPKTDDPCQPNNIRRVIDETWEIIKNAKQNTHNTLWNELPNSIIEDDPIITSIGNSRHKNTVIDISRRSKISPRNLTENDIEEFFRFIGRATPEPFNGQLSVIFKSYHLRMLDNKLNKIYKEEESESAGEYFNEHEFLERFGPPPWALIDSILSKLNLPFKAKSPSKDKRDKAFHFSLINKKSGEEISADNLSTGEKTLLSIAIAIYNCNEINEKPGLLLLDEPDASLHPSMSKLMLEIIEDEFVRKNKIPVIITTHSPTTIACCPGRSLYKLSDEDKVPRPCSMNESVELLSQSIPNLRVSTEHRRQIFVEHDYDVKYLEAIFSIVSRIKDFEITPQFLAPHSREGSNSFDVIEITKKLRDKGNSTVYGIVDWDLKNKPEDQLLILGEQNRYSIENYIFEPHFIGLFLIINNFESAINLGLPECNSYIEVSKLIDNNVEAIQRLVDSVTERIKWPGTSNNLTKSLLLSGQELEINSNFLHTQGHKLELLIKETWPQLNRIKSNNDGDSKLKMQIIDTVMKDFPALISNDIAMTFAKIT